jgi:hypothetical protein
MAKYILFYHPMHADNRRAERLLHSHNVKIHLADVTATGISAHILKDMGISELPALCITSGHRYTLYEGLDEIQDFVTKRIK